MTDKEFQALAAGHKNLNAFAALCQCHHETRVAGKPWASELCTAANNCAGIKAGGSWRGEVYKKVSWEQRADGTKYNAESAFRKYASVEAFLADYESKIAAMYPLCVERRDNFWGVFDGLLTGPYKWATDKAYFGRLAETAIRLAPEIFGVENAELKLKTALLYAIEKSYLSDANAAVALDVLGIYAANDGAKNRPIAPKIENAAALSANDGNKFKIICIDAGHGGRDPGACAGGVQEKDITLTMAKLIGAGLHDCKVIYTRSGDTGPELAKRTSMANEQKADLLISVHCNAATNADAQGCETWIYTNPSGASAMAAQSVHARMAQASVMKDRGIKRGNLHMVRESKMPAILVELGFITNAVDRAKLTDAAWQRNIADAIANGIKAVVS